MQTFLPYADFKKTAKILDRQRLGKQRVECLQILKCLLEKENRWKNHPAVRMWKNHEQCLILYGLEICKEWISRGYKDNCFEKISNFKEEKKEIIFPSWIGNENFHKSHQSNLIRKNAEHYKKFFPNVQDDLEYIWPV